MGSGGWYRTAYPIHTRLPGIPQAGSFGSNLWAKDLRDAHMVARKRRCGEIVIGGPTRKPTDHPSVGGMIRQGQPWPQVLHAACFVCWHATRAGVVAPDETLGDGGLLHGIAHAMTGVREKGARKRLANLADEIEARIPGWSRP